MVYINKSMVMVYKKKTFTLLQLLFKYFQNLLLFKIYCFKI